MIIVKLIDTDVIRDLAQCFGRTERWAEKRIKKYLDLIGILLLDAETRGASSWNKRFKLYSIPLKKLHLDGGRVSSNTKKINVRLHHWLEKSGYSFVAAVEVGSPLTAEISKVKTTARIEVQDCWLGFKDMVAFVNHLNSGVNKYREQINLLHSDIPNFNSVQATDPRFDFLNVDEDSLKAHLLKLWGIGNSASSNSVRGKIRRQLAQGFTILCIARMFDGFYPQRKSLSPFGRNYYTGVSIQNIKKDMRYAILGSCWEYDLKSAALTWRSGFISDFIATSKKFNNENTAFPSLLRYLNDRDSWMQDVCQNVFGGANFTAEQKAKIKGAMQALGFGAKKIQGDILIKSKNGESVKWKAAVAEIIDDAIHCKNFFLDDWVTKCINEMRLLGDFIYKNELKSNPTLKTKTFLLAPGGRLCKRKVLAYLFQHAETNVMDVVRYEIEQGGIHTVLANIHDCVITRDRIEPDLLKSIIDAVHAKTGNTRWVLTETQHC